MGFDNLGPDFIILGAQKAGTTWLARMLGRQEGVFIPPIKETHYFSKRYDRGEDWYHSFFSEGQSALTRGEATPNYLAVNYPEYQDVAHRIRAYRGDVRFIVVLRNPIDRALSAYLHHVPRGRFSPFENPEAHFGRLFDKEDMYGVLRFGKYCDQLSEYFAHFDRSRFLIVFYENVIARNPSDVVAEMLRFLGCPAEKPIGPFDERVNVSVRTRAAARVGSALSFWMLNDETRFRFGGAAARLARLADAVAGSDQMELGGDTRRRLVDYYNEDVAALHKLLDLPSPVWPEFSR